MDRYTDEAVRKYRGIEHLRVQLDVAEYEMEKLLARTINIKEYYAETEKIRIEFETIRKSLASRGRLPR